MRTPMPADQAERVRHHARARGLVYAGECAPRFAELVERQLARRHGRDAGHWLLITLDAGEPGGEPLLVRFWSSAPPRGILAYERLTAAEADRRLADLLTSPATARVKMAGREPRRES